MNLLEIGTDALETFFDQSQQKFESFAQRVLKLM